ncbi:prolyl oligopeptidase family serine peptidase [Yeosuana sp. MJ-SS3]|jgi:dipeptidyl aminopeptidase/acylaminoacyl peptidase|uniref:Prolyl oligopeptidase family serine peptidase n=1 Tax=Gilvirhabdus luticola TaxID=3079858 RepID=A0ABU3U9Y7_9FLAO|nr:prolyl oligopeptidase family serine peptidase [Yeosuana sp. MJ-SS3]MDU8887224.1 prolyl oligopeptidase family serine peptidase [Yeosuana sp. MJ-SS3]
MKTIFTILSALILTTSLYSQNGKLIAKKAVVFHDSIQQKFKENASFSEFHSTTDLFKITYLSDGLKINGYMAQPKESGVYPVIIFNRGGNRDFGSINDIRANFLLRKMASWGYVVAASNYRGGGGSEGMEEFGGADVNDVHNLIPLLANEKMADTSRMGIYGYSRGGLMTYRTISESCKFKAAIIGAGVTNSIRGIDKRPEMEQYVYSQLIPDYKNNKEKGLKDRSPIFWTDRLCKTTPIMLLHGSSDWRVSPEDALDMADSLYKYKHPFRFHFYEGADHGLSEYRSEVWQDVQEFFDYYVRDLEPLPNMEPHGR